MEQVFRGLMDMHTKCAKTFCSKLDFWGQCNLEQTFFFLSLGLMIICICYSIVKTKQFSRTWSIVQACQSFPSLLGVIVTGTGN